ncbi:MAG: hypothetical protein PVG41_21630 [Desulfobacteraceae bacterium]|jgi:hypothetical protein
MGETMQELQAFVDDWADTDERNKEAFVRLKSHLDAKEGVQLEFIPRPGVTYSLRATNQNQKQRSLFVMVDVIEDDPRWLSVCFYGDMISDPDEQGDFVPEGLLGEDAMCFDIDQYDDTLLQYVEARLDEACQSAAKG